MLCSLKTLKSLEVIINFTPVLPPPFYVCDHRAKRKKKKKKKEKAGSAQTVRALIPSVLAHFFSEMSVFFKDQL